MVSDNIEAIIFDLDGVIIDSKDVAYHALRASYNEVVGKGEPPPFSEFCKHFGLGFPEIMKRMNLPVDMYPVFVRESSNNTHRIKVFDGIVPMLKKLSEYNIKMAIATGKDGERTKKILSYLNMKEYFNIVLGFDEVDKPKPAPDMAIQIMQAMNVEPANTVFIGDAVADIQCGLQAGTQDGVACWDNPAEGVLQLQVDYLFQSPADVLTELGVISSAKIAIN